MRYMVNQSKMKLIEKANERHAKIRDLATAEQDMDNVHLKMKQHHDNLKDSGETMKDIQMIDIDAVNEYEDQYNAAHDFQIFQVGDKTKGGLMSLAQKQNQADLDASMSQSNGTFRSLPEGTIDPSMVVAPSQLNQLNQEIVESEVLPEDKEIESD